VTRLLPNIWRKSNFSKMNISVNRAISSKKRLIYSKTEVELYEYEHPYFYNKNVRRSHTFHSLVGARRTDNLQGVRNAIRRLVNANFASYGYEAVFLTFTFEKEVKNVDIANREFRNFVKRLNYEHKKVYKWLAVIEFQSSGRVHYHCIFFNMALDIEQRERCCARPCWAFKLGYCEHGINTRNLAILWGNGFVDIERIRSARNVGAYVCKYLDKSMLGPF